MLLLAQAAGPAPGPRARVASPLPLVRQYHEPARHELAPVVVAHGTRNEQQLARLDLALEERLARPRALEQAAVVFEHGPEHPQAAARRQQPRGNDVPDTARFLPHTDARQRCAPGRGEVAVRRAA